GGDLRKARGDDRYGRQDGNDNHEPRAAVSPPSGHGSTHFPPKYRPPGRRPAFPFARPADMHNENLSAQYRNAAYDASTGGLRTRLPIAYAVNTEAITNPAGRLGRSPLHTYDYDLSA